MKTPLLRILSYLGFGLLIIAGFFATPAYGEATDTSVSKWSLEVKEFTTNTFGNQIGLLLGGTASLYFGQSDFYWGLSGFVGTSTGDDLGQDNLYYGGIHIGHDKIINKWSTYDISLLLGYGVGRLRTVATLDEKSIVYEPALKGGLILGPGWRIYIGMSYIYQPNSRNFTGASFGLSIQYKTVTTQKGAMH